MFLYFILFFRWVPLRVRTGRMKTCLPAKTGQIVSSGSILISTHRNQMIKLEKHSPTEWSTPFYRVRPDFIQVDCKGHPGISSYPTEVGFRAAKYWRDPMKIWREETAKKGVALYVHFSGIYDKKVATEYPDWAIVDGTGKRSESILSPISPYDSVFLIPQMKELINKYDIDGAWIDGECWQRCPITAMW